MTVNLSQGPPTDALSNILLNKRAMNTVTAPIFCIAWRIKYKQQISNYHSIIHLPIHCLFVLTISTCLPCDVVGIYLLSIYLTACCCEKVTAEWDWTHVPPITRGDTPIIPVTWLTHECAVPLMSHDNIKVMSNNSIHVIGYIKSGACIDVFTYVYSLLIMLIVLINFSQEICITYAHALHINFFFQGKKSY